MSPKTQASVSAKGQRKQEAQLTAAVRTKKGRTVYVELTAERKNGGPSPDALPIVRRHKPQPRPAAAAPAKPAPAVQRPAAPAPVKPEAPQAQRPAEVPQPPRPIEVLNPPAPVQEAPDVPALTSPLQTPPPATAAVGNIEDLPTEAQLKKAQKRGSRNHIQGKITSLPEEGLLRAELERIYYRRRFAQTVKSVVSTLITVAAASVLVAVLLLPVLRIYGTSMTPTLTEGNIVASLKGSSFETGDVIAFYYNNKILVKRVIAQAGQWVNIDADGTVYVDNVEIDEPYIDEKAFGECDIELPYQVPEGRVFVMGDHRAVSVDSRNTSIGCVAEEQIVGKIMFRIWPPDDFGRVN